MHMRTALYLRQSVGHDEGIERQRTRTGELATARGWQVIEEYVDNDVSASRTRGPSTGWGKMLAAASEGRVEAVVAVDLDRLLRSNRDLIALIDAGLKVVTVDGEIDLSTADGEFRAQMLASIARFEVRRKSERQVRANEYRATQGIPAGGARPFGWEEDRVTVRESEAQHVRWAFEHVLDGGSIRDVIRHFAEQGVQPRRAAQWSTAQVRKMLARPRNAGLFVRLGVLQPESQIQPIVSREQWEAVVALLNSRSTRGRGRPPVQAFLSGVLVCGGCGSALQSNWSTVRGVRVRAYICRRRIDQTHREGEVHYSMYASVAEPAVVAALWRLMKDTTGAVEAPDVIALRSALTDVEVQRARAQRLFVMGGADDAQTQQILRELGRKAERIQSDIDRMLAGNVVRSLWTGLEPPAPGSWLTQEGEEEFAQRFEALTVDQKRQVVRAQFPAITVVRSGRGAGRLVYTTV